MLHHDLSLNCRYPRSLQNRCVEDFGDQEILHKSKGIIHVASQQYDIVYTVDSPNKGNFGDIISSAV